MTATVDNAVTDLQRAYAELQRRFDEAVAERDEALARETATAEVLQLVNSSPGDLTPVFDAILDKAHRLCGATRGTLFLFDGETFRAAAMHGYPAPAQGAPPRAISVSEDPRLAALLGGERLIHVPDLTKIDDPIARAVAERGGVRTNLLLPLRRDGALLGVISCNRHEVCPFSDKDISLLENFAAQAVIAMENARLITETREALDQQTATAEVLQVINSSPGDLAPVFEAMLDKAMTLCSAAFGALMSYDDEKVSAVATRGLPPELVDVFREPIVPRRDGDGPYARFLRGEPLQHIVDMAAADVLSSLASRPRALAEIGGARTGLEIPLRKEGALLGSIWFYRREVRPFSDKQIALLQNFAAQAVIAMENARLITETREALEQQTATAELLGVINSSPGDLAPVFDAMLEKAMRLCEAEFGTLATSDGNSFHTAATRGVPAAFAEYRKNNPPSYGPGSLVARILGGEPLIHTVDLAAEEIYRSGDPNRRAVVDLGGARTSLVVPLLKNRDVLGIITIYRKEVRPFSDKQIALLQNFAAQAVIAMENARLLGELHQRTEEIGEWNRKLEARVAAQVDELGRVEQLKRFLPPQLAELIVSQGDESVLKSHRCEIVVVFADVRGYTAFTESAEPEEVIEFLSEYHATLGPLITRFEGTLSHFFGDGVMVFFNDPVPCPDPAERAVKMAVAMREAAGNLVAAWRRRGHQIGFGVGIAQGYATLGQIGFADRSDYTAIGTVTNLAARLCDAAKDGQILLARRVAIAVEATATLEEIGDLSLKGLSQAVAVYNLVAVGVQPSAS